MMIISQYPLKALFSDNFYLSGNVIIFHITQLMGNLDLKPVSVMGAGFFLFKSDKKQFKNCATIQIKKKYKKLFRICL